MKAIVREQSNRQERAEAIVREQKQSSRESNRQERAEAIREQSRKRRGQKLKTPTGKTFQAIVNVKTPTGKTFQAIVNVKTPTARNDNSTA